MVRTRLLNNCLVGKVTPTPLATNFVMENGIYEKMNYCQKIQH